MKVSIGSDHRGIAERKIVSEAVRRAGHEVDDRGTDSTESCDYPDIAADVGQEVATGRSDMGILVCGTGIGMAIAANKIDGIRAALACDKEMARLSRSHNDANILCLNSSGFSDDDYREIATQWLATEFEGGRHARRVEKIRRMESHSNPN